MVLTEILSAEKPCRARVGETADGSARLPRPRGSQPSVEGLLDAGGLPHLVVGHHEEHARVAYVVRGEHQAEQRQGELILLPYHLTSAARGGQASRRLDHIHDTIE
jgi:hypothetical protein